MYQESAGRANPTPTTWNLWRGKELPHRDPCSQGRPRPGLSRKARKWGAYQLRREFCQYRAAADAELRSAGRTRASAPTWVVGGAGAYVVKETDSGWGVIGCGREINGRRISTRKPPSVRFWAKTRPPWKRTALSVIASPNPTPPVRRPRASSSR